MPTRRESNATKPILRRFAARTRCDVAIPPAEAGGYRSFAADAAKRIPRRVAAQDHADASGIERNQTHPAPLRGANTL